MPGRAETHEMAGMRGGEVTAGEPACPPRGEMVATRQVHTGEIEVEKHVVSEQRTIEVPVSHTEVEVERRPVTGEARYQTEGEISEGEVRIPVREEEVHIEKRPVVKEEIIVRQHPETEMERRARRSAAGAEVPRRATSTSRQGVDVETESNIDRSRRRTG